MIKLIQVSKDKNKIGTNQLHVCSVPKFAPTQIKFNGISFLLSLSEDLIPPPLELSSFCVCLFVCLNCCSRTSLILQRIRIVLKNGRKMIMSDEFWCLSELHRFNLFVHRKFLTQDWNFIFKKSWVKRSMVYPNLAIKVYNLVVFY